MLLEYLEYRASGFSMIEIGDETGAEADGEPGRVGQGFNYVAAWPPRFRQRQPTGNDPRSEIKSLGAYWSGTSKNTLVSHGENGKACHKA